VELSGRWLVALLTQRWQQFTRPTEKYTRDRAEVLLPYPQVVHELRENNVHPVEKVCTTSFLLWVVGYQVEALLEQRVWEGYNRLKKEGTADVATA
jgi:hypothetical protein